jgi:hypothetical protein
MARLRQRRRWLVLSWLPVGSMRVVYRSDDGWSLLLVAVAPDVHRGFEVVVVDRQIVVLCDLCLRAGPLFQLVVYVCLKGGLLGALVMLVVCRTL